MQELGLTFYGYGSEVNPFSCRVVCGKCGAVCGKKSWKSRGVEFWQCNNRSKNHGVKGCASENLPHENLLKGFVTAWNQIVAEREQRRESVRKTSCRTNDRINVATTSYKDAARTWTDGFGKGNCTGKRNIVYSIFGWHGD